MPIVGLLPVRAVEHLYLANESVKKLKSASVASSFIKGLGRLSAQADVPLLVSLVCCWCRLRWVYLVCISIPCTLGWARILGSGIHNPRLGRPSVVVVTLTFKDTDIFST